MGKTHVTLPSELIDWKKPQNVRHLEEAATLTSRLLEALIILKRDFHAALGLAIEPDIEFYSGHSASQKMPGRAQPRH